MSARGWSGTISRGTPPMNSSASMIEPTQSAVVCVAVAQAYVKLDAPSTDTKIWARRISPLLASITGTVCPA
jgi:xanthine dehydrogenase molybdopterin-binding subunit B